MVHCSATHDDAFEGTTRSVGCTSALLPRISAKAIARWFRKVEKTVSNSKAEPNSARHAPFVLEIGGSTKTLLKPIDEAREVRISAKPLTTWLTNHKNDTPISHSAGRPPFYLEIGSTAGRTVKTRTLSSEEGRAEMRRVLTRNPSSEGIARCLDRGGSVKPLRVRQTHRIDPAPAARTSSVGMASTTAQRNARDSKGARSHPAKRRG
jgi:hypothetical protein